MLPDGARVDVVHALPPGSTVLLYTDGLVEHREESLTVGLARLRDAAARHAGEGVEQLCDSLLAELCSGGCDDDVALLALRVPQGTGGGVG